MKLHALVLVGAALLLAADTPKEDAAKKELQKLQGTWTAVESQMEGLKDTKIGGDAIRLPKIRPAEAGRGAAWPGTMGR
jgi:hypothetical protein